VYVYISGRTGLAVWLVKGVSRDDNSAWQETTGRFCAKISRKTYCRDILFCESQKHTAGL
jgi:hypothetical protein